MTIEYCPYVKLDFHSATRGDWVTTEWQTSHGAKIHVETAPDCGSGVMGDDDLMAARVFSSSYPGMQANLGSPNRGCNGTDEDQGPNSLGTYPGEGDGGDPVSQIFSRFWNCRSQENLVVIDGDGDSSHPTTASCGGDIVFEFSTPVNMTEVGILSGDEAQTGGDEEEAPIQIYVSCSLCVKRALLLLKPSP